MLAFLDARGVDKLLCLGDLVGYNADPNRCVRLLEAREALAIVGNHDLIAAGEIGTERCSDKAAFALRRTRQTVTPPTLLYLLQLPRVRVVDGGVILVHGSFSDVCEYMRDEQKIEENLPMMRRLAPEAWICLFGHTHAPVLYAAKDGEVVSLELGEDIPLQSRRRVFFANPGSVDAARRGDSHAEFAVLDTDRREISYHRIPYNHAIAERRAQQAGYRMGWADERVYEAARAIRRGKRIMQVGVERALGALRM
ncbi:metallophosphoesterase family protein [Chondromyces apiculatus]|uniref:metallophosphoesterase family protein n=1 Tax=Chondromyces apiculatus TaxID=51 RepID=UPI001E5718F3|nr:metallophosphoesterase family protein [Chondromyces apiculatus]